MINKKLIIKNFDKLGRIAEKAYGNRNIELLLESLSSRAHLQYTINQVYKDDFIDGMVKKISKLNNENLRHIKDDKTVLFYDGFGSDTRGLAYIYLKALKKLGFNITYISEAIDSNKQPVISNLLNDKKVYYKPKKESQKDKLNRLREIFNNESFSYALFYSSPWDIVGNIAFYELKDKCTRYLINLTDHAFWVGRNACDYVIEFRNYGASISYYERYIDKDKLLLLPYYPIVDNISEFKGFPFKTENKKVIYSGGSLYKTIDSNKTYYKLVEKIINRHEDVIFYYTGSGNNKFIKELVSKYPNQIYFEKERIDLLEAMKRSYLYLNTYPISGGLMLQYAAIAGCIPITLKRQWDDDASGLLLNESELNEMFIDENELLNEIDMLVKDDKYYKEKKELLNKSVITEQAFTDALSTILTNPKEKVIKDIEYVDTKLYRENYLESVDNNELYYSIINKENIKLIKYFPFVFIYRLLKKVGNNNV